MPDLMDTYIENRWLVQPNHANNLQTTHGGNVLKWMDELGALSAMRFSGENCVTARMDQVNFKRPIPVGDVALIRAYVFEAGRTSVQVRLEAFREDPRTGDRVPTTESYSVYVAVDDDGEPTSVPELTVDSERGCELHEQAVAENAER
ncbi:Acyl-CoA hydrolase [Halomicrobium zhouii]|uniref:Acyl-CoA hydrolase n=1 Tax=Halomicrobium zhouii TaxID=767519 RepID=A0A1I6LST9_9EURY|nr:acyl-CoA thioesterase [Halomicrobium zhouii]SFS06489.1 Acyl-CoA hydrolase [Halomicrobium zhouii]